MYIHIYIYRFIEANHLHIVQLHLVYIRIGICMVLHVHSRVAYSLDCVAHMRQ